MRAPTPDFDDFTVRHGTPIDPELMTRTEMSASIIPIEERWKEPVLLAAFLS
jgi:hypothetical protein